MTLQVMAHGFEAPCGRPCALRFASAVSRWRGPRYGRGSFEKKKYEDIALRRVLGRTDGARRAAPRMTTHD